MGSRPCQEIKLDDITLSSWDKKPGKKVEQGGNVQVSQYFNLQAIWSVLTKCGQIMMRETVRDKGNAIAGYSHRGNSCDCGELSDVWKFQIRCLENFQMFVESFELIQTTVYEMLEDKILNIEIFFSHKNCEYIFLNIYNIFFQ